MGFRRPDGEVGTRNYLAIVSTVNCSAHATRQIAARFSTEQLAGFPNVNGVAAFTHPSGCTFQPDSGDHLVLQKTLAGIIRHPNVGAVILVGLGCELNLVCDLMEKFDLTETARKPLVGLEIQEAGGIRKTIEAGVGLVNDMLPQVNAAGRSPQPISGLQVALQCGGSDSWSGVTANPLVGLVSDRLVQAGGGVLLAETPEIFGAEHLLAGRAVSPQVVQNLLDKVEWWQTRARRFGFSIDSNRSPGNQAGGLTTIYEKSLGAIAKGGSSPLMAVYDYAEPVMGPGLRFMDTPGNDWMSVTGQMAGGCNLVIFTTGRGSVFGSKPAPTIKVCSNSATYQHMIDDMDFNAGQVLEGVDMQVAADALFDLVLRTASGEPSKSEACGVGEAEFGPWQLGGTL
jgi:altronate dehydratase